MLCLLWNVYPLSLLHNALYKSILVKNALFIYLREPDLL